MKKYVLKFLLWLVSLVLSFLLNVCAFIVGIANVLMFYLYRLLLVSTTLGIILLYYKPHALAISMSHLAISGYLGAFLFSPYGIPRLAIYLLSYLAGWNYMLKRFRRSIGNDNYSYVDDSDDFDENMSWDDIKSTEEIHIVPNRDEDYESHWDFMKEEDQQNDTRDSQHSNHLHHQSYQRNDQRPEPTKEYPEKRRSKFKS